MKGKTKILCLLIIIFVIFTCSLLTTSNKEIRSIRNERQLNSFYEQDSYEDFTLLERALMLPLVLVLIIMYTEDMRRIVGELQQM